MRNRLRLAMVATALLYLGPLMAGLAGYGWGMVPAFAVIFLLWLIVMRPKLWPRDPAAWQQRDVIVAAAAQFMVQVLIVVLCFGIGRGIGGVAGVVPMWTPMFPLALSLVAIPLTRIVGDSGTDAQINGFPDDAAQHPGGASSQANPRLASALAPVLDLTAGTPDAAAIGVVDRALGAAGGLNTAALPALVGQLDAVGASRPAARRALVLWATRPEVLDDQSHRGALKAGFAVTWADTNLLHLYAERALPLIEARPAAWPDFPDVSEVRHSIDKANPTDLNALLERLADRLQGAMQSTPPGS